MFKRTLESEILNLSNQYPVISITGPRQSGKTTLSQKIFPNYYYTNLENPLTREYAKNDPQAFLNQNKLMIIDEIQRIPDLFSFLQVIVDDDKTRKFVITGSQNFLISEKVSQTLAGRVAIFKLLPLSFRELKMNNSRPKDVINFLLRGSYPKVYDQQLDANKWYSYYVETYLQRDVREIEAILDLSQFQKFLVLLAGRTGQILNLASLGNDTGVSSTTIKSWLSILEASYITFRLLPYHQNINKRLVKSPKIYFYDTGLVCALLNIRTRDQLMTHPLIGNIFETFVVSEFQKENLHQQQSIDFYFFRDKIGNEIDLVYLKESSLHLVEIKSAQSFNPRFMKVFNYFEKLSPIRNLSNKIVYGGNEYQKRTNFELFPWDEFEL